MGDFVAKECRYNRIAYMKRRVSPSVAEIRRAAAEFATKKFQHQLTRFLLQKYFNGSSFLNERQIHGAETMVDEQALVGRASAMILIRHMSARLTLT